MIPHLLNQHAVDAAMAWLRRRSAAHAPHYTLKDLAKLDGKVEAFVDGLRVAGDPNTGMASDTTDGSKTVKISGKEVRRATQARMAPCTKSRA